MVKQFSIPGRFRLLCIELANNLTLIQLIENQMQSMIGVEKIKFNRRSKRFLVKFNQVRTTEDKLVREISRIASENGVDLKLINEQGITSEVVEEVLYDTAFDVVKKMALPILLAPLGGKYKLLFGVATGLLRNSMKHRARIAAHA